MTQVDLQAAIELARRGEKQTALLMLKEIVRNELDNEQAWIWLAECLEIDDQRKYCLQQVTRINPGNRLARNILEKMDASLIHSTPSTSLTPEALPQTSSFTPPTESPAPQPASVTPPAEDSVPAPVVSLTPEPLPQTKPFTPKTEPPTVQPASVTLPAETTPAPVTTLTPEPLPQTKPFTPKTENPASQPEVPPTVETIQPAAPAVEPAPELIGQWQVEEVAVPFGFTGPKMDAIRHTIQERLQYAWTYIGHDMAGFLPANMQPMGFNPLTPYAKHPNKTHLAFARHPAIKPSEWTDTPFAVLPWNRPGEKRRYGMRRQFYYYLKSLHGRALAYCVIDDDEDQTGFNNVMTLYSDELCHHPLVEARDNQLVLYDAGSEHLGASLTMVADKPVVTTVDGRQLIVFDKAENNIASFLLPQGWLLLTVDGEVFRVGTLTRLSEDDEWLVRMFSVMARFSMIREMEFQVSQQNYSFVHVIQ